jgi:hypothetical protein
LRYLTSALVAGAALALTATATFGQPTSEGGSAPLDRNNLHTIICKQYAAATGSRIGHRVICLTNAQWDEIHRQAREGIMLEEKKSYSSRI